VLNDALVEGMRIVAVDFPANGIPVRSGGPPGPRTDEGRNGNPAPLLAETGWSPFGKIVHRTVKGDIHDIGKNLVR